MSVGWMAFAKAGAEAGNYYLKQLDQFAQQARAADMNNAQYAVGEAQRDAQNTLSASYASLQNFYRDYQNRMLGKKMDQARADNMLQFATEVDKLYEGNLKAQEEGAVLVGQIAAYSGATGIGGGSLAVIAQNQELQNAMYKSQVTGNKNIMRSQLLSGVNSASLKQALGTNFEATIANIDRVQKGFSADPGVSIGQLVAMDMGGFFTFANSLLGAASDGAFNTGGRVSAPVRSR